VLFEFHEKVIEKGTLTGPVRPLEDVYSVLLRPVSERGKVTDEPVREKPVCEKGVIRPLHKELAAVIGDVANRLGIVGVFIDSLACEGHYHVADSLEHVSKDKIRIVRRKLGELRELHGGALFPLANPRTQVHEDLFYCNHGASHSQKSFDEF